jgi:hypothetical protein
MHVTVLESNHPIARSLQPFCTGGIVGCLIRVGVGVTVNLDDQYRLGAIEICNEPINDVLPPNLEAEAVVADPCPNDLFRWRERVAHIPGAFKNGRVKALPFVGGHWADFPTCQLVSHLHSLAPALLSVAGQVCVPVQVSNDPLSRK